MNTTARRVLIVAEAGVNHNGSLDLARRLVDVAAEAGADVVKFQTFQASKVASARARKADYQAVATGAAESQLEMLRKLQLSDSDHEALNERAKSKGIGMLSTPFDLPSLRMLVSRMRFEVIKVPSGEITNGPFLLEVARTGRKVILSTGMSTLAEVETALSVLAFGYADGTADAQPGADAFARAFASDGGQRLLREKVTLLHCTTEYPAPFAETNLCAMDTLAAAFRLPVGFSDHTPGIHISVAAVARGACLVEKHFTLDRTMAGPDHAASLEPGELAMMIRHIRDVEVALGDGVKRSTSSELKNLPIARRSLVAAVPIKRGEVFSADNLACKRPGNGVSPMQYWRVVGQVASRDFDADDAIVA
ncbi:MAG: N-acetylneuraminate synthase [Steroidobacteraceae bacterium]